jgi:hypothetical protein
MWFVLIFILYPQFHGAPYVVTQSFTDEHACKEAAQYLMDESDIQSSYINSYAYENRTKPKWSCLPERAEGSH